MIKLFEAFDGVFTHGQQQDIINMSLHAENKKVNLYDLLKFNPPMVKSPLPKNGEKIVVKHFKATCPECGKALNMSPVDERSEKYKEGYRTYFLCGASCCNGKGCGFEEFSRLIIKD